MSDRRRPTLRRREGSFERSRPWGIAAFLLGATGLAAAYFGFRLIRQSSAGAASPTFWLISALGLAALLLVLVAGFYSARKRMLQERVGGTMMAWFKSHLYLGFAALVVAVAHWLLFPLTTDLTSGKLSLALLGLLVLSGAGWRLVYARVPPKVPRQTGNLSIRDTRERAADLRVEIEKAKVGRSREFQTAVDDLLAQRRGPDELAGAADALDDEEQRSWARVLGLAHDLELESRREKQQRRLSLILQAWRALHLPLALALLVAIGFHLYDVFNVGTSFEGSTDAEFASADDCASCHADIVDEWKLSAHRNAQTSTITRAQTLFALEKNPEFRKDCVNCHAPIATKFSNDTTFPLGEDPGVDPTSAGTEGISCVVCHTMEEHPEELSGFSDDLPIGRRTRLNLGKMYGPPLEDPAAQPNSAHDVGRGFMTDEIASSQMCGACHNVAADIDGDGLGAAGSESVPRDSDGDGVLDENEIDADSDLVLQTTFDEWENYIFAEAGVGASCVDCHMPPAQGEVSAGSPLIGSPERERNRHVFVGVDYELDARYYEQPGMPENALEDVLEERERLLARAVSIEVETQREDSSTLSATVSVENRTGHNFPTGFAFVREFWLEVSARTTSGKRVCLVARDGIPSPCSSGRIESPQDDLQTCDVQPIADEGLDVEMLSVFPTSGCDPWLVNFQKILTDADKDGDGVLREVPFQSKAGGVVKDRLRAVTDPGDGGRQVLDEIPPGNSDRFVYLFDIGDAGVEQVSVEATLRHRHLAPYFVRALDPYFSRDDPTAAQLLENMTVVDVASNKPLGDDRTTPEADELVAAPGLSEGEAPRAGTESTGTSSWGIVPVATALGGIPLVLWASCRRRRTTRPGAA
ncbi:MAG: cytochrome c family protein [Actinomycetota bacterium]|nr:cytochrome c family protein [Actinomycetota bacterium]